jgi:hypothetical protein
VIVKIDVDLIPSKLVKAFISTSSVVLKLTFSINSIALHRTDQYPESLVMLWWHP